MAKVSAVSKAEELRRQLGLSVVALASRAGVHHSYISLVEGGHRRPSTGYRELISKALGVPEEVAFPGVGG